MQAMHSMQPLAYACGLKQWVILIITPWILTYWENRSYCITMYHQLLSKQIFYWEECLTRNKSLAHLSPWQRAEDWIIKCPCWTLYIAYTQMHSWEKQKNWNYKKKHFRRLAEVHVPLTVHSLAMAWQLTNKARTQAKAVYIFVF